MRPRPNAKPRSARSAYRLSNDNSGSVVTIVALTVFAMFGAVGVALDFAAASRAKTKALEIADATLLAAGHKFSSMDQTQLDTYAEQYFNTMSSGLRGLENKNVVLTKDTANKKLKITVTGKYKTTLLTVLGRHHFNVRVQSEVKIGTGKLEVALVLDNTGSMAPYMSDLKAAAADLANKLHDASNGSDLKLALVPYVGTVNIGSDKMAYMDTAGASQYHAQTFRGRWIASEPGCTPGSGGGTNPGPGTGGGDRTDASPHIRTLTRFAGYLGSFLFGSPAHAASSSDVPAPYTLENNCFMATPNNVNLFTDILDNIPNASWKGCVEARPAPFDVTDAVPDVATPNTMFVPWVWPDEPDASYVTGFTNDYLPDGDLPTPPGVSTSIFEMYSYGRVRAIHKYDGTNASGLMVSPPITKGPNQGCPDAITPLTSTKSTILNKINSMDAWIGGGTNAHLGVVWGWRVLSPAPPFTEGEPSNQTNKVIVLMTDGKNVIEPHSDGAIYSDFSAYGYLTENRLGLDRTYDAYNSHIDSRMLQACANAKADKVKIYTITFGALDSATKTLYENCSSGPLYAYNATTVSELAKAFDKIGDELSMLRLVK